MSADADGRRAQLVTARAPSTLLTPGTLWVRLPLSPLDNCLRAGHVQPLMGFRCVTGMGLSNGGVDLAALSPDAAALKHRFCFADHCLPIFASLRSPSPQARPETGCRIPR
jgi:hypothetical protein